MSRLNLTSPELMEIVDAHGEGFGPLRVLGLTTALLGVVTLGLFVGRELRIRYKFRRRTPSDFFANAGDPIPTAEYGLGV